MINLPYNVAAIPPIMPYQNVPVQTSQNNFPTFQQPQTSAQQMQTSPYNTVCPGNPADPIKQGVFYQYQQPDMFSTTYPNQPNTVPTRNPCQPVFQIPCNVPPSSQGQPGYNSLPQSVLDQIRTCVSTASPIFILPGGCHQSANGQQQSPPLSTPNNQSVLQSMGQPVFNYPPSIYPPPTFYPYPIPLPLYGPQGHQQFGPKERPTNCGYCQRRQDPFDCRNYPSSCCHNVDEEHRCTDTLDDTICSRRNCPSAISLQALASQFLSLPGIISCAATRLILRKIPGSNVTNTVEDTMEKARRCISVLNKEQLLTESRNAQQVNGLINLHMTNTLPANVVPILTFLQLKVNLLKAQVESLIHKKVMENQGYCAEVETTATVDPSILAVKTNAELRQILSILRQKECDERVNVNFSPYHSQRAIAETRLTNVQNKIRQVETEMERRRCVSVPQPTLTSRIVQQFTESHCTFDYGRSRFFDFTHGDTFESPDPFASSRNPRRLYIKPHSEPAITSDSKATDTEDVPQVCNNKDAGVNCSREHLERRSSSENDCSCEDSVSEESLDEDKKKLRPGIDEGKGNGRISRDDLSETVSLTRIEKDVTGNGSGLITERIEGGSTLPVVDKKELTTREDVDNSSLIIIEIPKKEPPETLEVGSSEFEIPRPDGKIPKERKVPTDEKKDDVGTKTKKSAEEVKGKESVHSGKSKESSGFWSRLKKIKRERMESSVPTIKRERISVTRESINSGHLPIKEEVDSDVDETEESEFDPGKWIKTEPKSVEDVKPIIKTETKSESFHGDEFTTQVENERDDEETKGSHYGTTKFIQIGQRSTESLPKTDEKTEIEKPKYTTQLEIPPRTDNVTSTSSPKTYTTTAQIQIKPRHTEYTSTIVRRVPNVEDSQKSTTGHLDTSLQGTTSTSREKVRENESQSTDETKTGKPSSSSPFKSVFQLTLKPTKKKVVTMGGTEPASRYVSTYPPVSVTGTNVADEESSTENRGNVTREHVVAMMTNIKYDRPFGDYGRLMGTDESVSGKTEDPSGSSSMDDSLKTNGVEGPPEENYARRPPPPSFLSRKMDLSTVSANRRYEAKSTVINTAGETSRVNAVANEVARIESDDDEENEIHRDNGGMTGIEKNTGHGVKHFPPLTIDEHERSRDATGIGIAENLFHSKEIESNSRKTICERGTSYHCDTGSRNSFASVLYSMIGNHLPPLGSLMDNIANLRTALPNLCSAALSNNSGDISPSSSTVNDDSMESLPCVIPRRETIDRGGNKSSREIKDHILFLSGGNKDLWGSAGVESEKIHRLKHSIMIDRDNNNFVLIGGSPDDQRRELLRNGLKEPYEIRRSLIIRSRLKDPGKRSDGNLCPVMLLKRSARNGVFGVETKESRVKGDYELKESKKFWSLPAATRTKEQHV